MGIVDLIVYFFILSVYLLALFRLAAALIAFVLLKVTKDVYFLQMLQISISCHFFLIFNF